MGVLFKKLLWPVIALMLLSLNSRELKMYGMHKTSWIAVGAKCNILIGLIYIHPSTIP